MRKLELFRLDWKDIDFKSRIITVKVSKAKKVRRIPISKELMPVLMSYRKPEGLICDLHNHRRVLKRIFRVATELRAKVVLSKTLKGKSPEASRKIILEECKKHPIQGGWHHFRHTFCTMTLLAGVDLKTVCELAGHSSITITAKYITTTPAHMADAVNRLKFT
jgi:integrase/recombinase XerC/integrase/recombinase XerD